MHPDILLKRYSKYHRKKKSIVKRNKIRIETLQLIFLQFKFVWIDDNYMGTALTNELSRLTNDLEFVFESVRQHFLFESHLVRKEEASNVYYHGFNNFTGENSCCKWGRGN
jgi:rhamnogalacturonyl hydrolase YesR